MATKLISVRSSDADEPVQHMAGEDNVPGLTGTALYVKPVLDSGVVTDTNPLPVRLVFED